MNIFEFLKDEKVF